LYERWSEDRQAAAAQGADMAELVRLFTLQVESFNTDTRLPFMRKDELFWTE
jgi:hypothetical protein